MNYINLQKQSSCSKDSNTTTAGFKCVGKWEGGNGGPTSSMPFKWIQLLCRAGYLAKNGSEALSSKSRRRSVFNFSACRYLACIITQALYEPSEANAAFCSRREKRGEEKIKRLQPVHCSDSSAHLRPQILTDGYDVKRTNENTIQYSKIVTFLGTKNADSSINPRK